MMDLLARLHCLDPEQKRVSTVRLDNGRDRRDGEAEESLDIDAGQDDDS